ncbi:MAG: lipocalin-like domain-containing protein [Gammaproteobacteria bacterium]
MPDARAHMTAGNIDLHGSWRLLSVVEYTDGRVTNPYFQGRNPVGFIHYLHDGRVAVLIANDGRRLMSADRYTSPVQECAESSRTFTGYGGRFTRTGNQVVHHLDVSSYENDVGTDYVRTIEVDGGRLILGTLPMQLNGRTRVLKLTWERVVPASGP